MDILHRVVGQVMWKDCHLIKRFVRQIKHERHTPRSSKGLGTPWPPCCRMWV
jgi:hypothetical protein